MQVGIGLVMMPPVIAAFTWILQHTGPMVPLYLWSFIFGLQIFFMTIYPIAIAPLFNKFSPVEKGTLKCAHTCDPGAVVQVFLHIVPAAYCSNSWVASKPHRSSPCMRGMYCRPANNCRASRWGFSALLESQGLIASAKPLFRAAESADRTIIPGVLRAGTRLRSWRGPCSSP